MHHTSILLFCLILLANPAHAEPDWEKYGMDRTLSYSATRHIESSDGIVDFVEHRRPKMIRMEMSLEGQAGVMIMREDLGVSYMLMPATTMYMELNQHQVKEQDAKELDVFEGKKMGAETVNGHPSTKYKGKFKDSEGGRGGGYFWVTDGGVLIKVDAIYSSDGKKGQRFVMELRDLQVGPQDMALFEVPKNYTSMSIGGLGSGGIPGLSGSQVPNATPQAPSAPIAQATTADNLTQMIQKDLVRLGYNPGNTNGEVTTATIVAISKFQAGNNLEVTGETSPQLAGILSAKASSSAPANNAMTQNPSALQATQQACLEKAMADGQPKKKKKKMGFGSLMSAVSKTANLLGKNKFASDMAQTTNDIYEVNSTAKDYAQAAKDLGLTEEQVADCQNPQ